MLLSAIQQALERSRAPLGEEAEIQELRERYASLTPRERGVMTLVVPGFVKQTGRWRARLQPRNAPLLTLLKRRSAGRKRVPELHAIC